MAIKDALLPEFDHEMANTRKTVERIPEDKLGWKPHEKSMALGHLVTHLTFIPSWVAHTISQDSLDLEPPGGEPIKIDPITSRQDALSRFDKNVAAARDAIAGASDEDLMKPWTLLKGAKPMFTLPRIAVLRSLVMNHTIHHRAQLGVYLRLNDIPVPSIYGPSADEAM